jgi:hypothetical protein
MGNVQFKRLEIPSSVTAFFTDKVDGNFKEVTTSSTNSKDKEEASIDSSVD